MKRIVAVFLFSILVFQGCGEKTPYLVSITNGSSKSVSYNFYKFTDTLNASQTKTYEVWDPYVGPPKNVIDGDGIASIAIEQNGMNGNYTFFDLEPIYLSVINSLPIEVNIKADNYIYDETRNSTVLKVNANTSVSEKKLRIYTTKPKFIETFGYPVVIEWNIVDLYNNEINKTEKWMHIIIR
ncbi:MAG: hypothetical protein LBQ89_02020 [Treponema sp.]|jgi:hypothetical protein|nr:hypothetical protein [Treponema sp.]